MTEAMRDELELIRSLKQHIRTRRRTELTSRSTKSQRTTSIEARPHVTSQALAQN